MSVCIENQSCLLQLTRGGSHMPHIPMLWLCIRGSTLSYYACTPHFVHTDGLAGSRRASLPRSDHYQLLGLAWRLMLRLDWRCKATVPRWLLCHIPDGKNLCDSQLIMNGHSWVYGQPQHRLGCRYLSSCQPLVGQAKMPVEIRDYELIPTVIPWLQVPILTMCGRHWLQESSKSLLLPR